MNRHVIEGAVLVLSLFLTGVDAKATAANVDNLTQATAWVSEWADKAYEVATSPKGTCENSHKELLNSFFKQSNTTLAVSGLSNDDVLHLQDAAFIAENIIERKSCVTYKTDMALLFANIKNRLK